MADKVLKSKTSEGNGKQTGRRGSEDGRVLFVVSRESGERSPNADQVDDAKATRTRVVRRLSLELPERASRHLEWLEEETGSMSVAEVIRDAVKLYYGLVKEVKDGGVIHIRSGDGEEKELRIFL